ncbi:NAD(P)-binding domain-containing protein [Paenibacillus agricola]|uniref:NAD-binding protein n=1 Tax=Paenibacillus agricola TaxID=2716264 RepID=A0ABX0J963_9BACL|nr:NAD(P)-binding domain-containing protein [Paenibacillus agricola]NHN32909.1 NAD-binding protein [Paenibacillus agricola]
MKVGFIGLGTMGTPMVINLLKRGFSVTVYNRTASKADALVVLGATAASTPTEAAQEADVLITMLSDDATVQELILGKTGMLDGLSAGQTVIDCSTVSPETSQRIHKALQERAIEFLDAPVTGSKPGAENGTLVFMVGGSQSALDKQRPVFEAMGTRIVHMGASGSGSAAKLAHNTIAAVNLLGFIEGLSMATKAGLDPERFVEVVLAGGASSKQVESKGDKIINRDFRNQFSLQLMLKDLLLAGDLSNSYQLPLPLQKAATSMFQIGLAKGLGDQDTSSIIRCYEDWMHTEVTKQASGQERRRNTRLHLNIPLLLSVYQWEQEGAFTGQTIEGQLFDLSETGIQIVSPFPLAQDMFVVIHFPQEADLPPITAKVIRIENDNGNFRYGCMLSGLAPYVRLKIEDYIAIYPFISGEDYETAENPY